MKIMNGRVALLALAVSFIFFVSPLSPFINTVQANQVDILFTGWLAAVKKEATIKGVSEVTLQSAFKNIKLNPKVIKLDRNQPEFKITFQAYLDRVISKRRITKGRKLLSEHKAFFTQLEKETGVPGRFLVALWGMETDFGRLTGGFSVIEALSTLAFDGRRSRYFRHELLQALMILDQGHIEAENMRGSWAGAMGQTQFMPSTFTKHAIDYSGDGKIDIWNQQEDALGSGAYYLANEGWVAGQTWGRAVLLPAAFDVRKIGLAMTKTLDEWAALGVTRGNGKALPNSNRIQSSLVRAENDPEQRVFVVYNNFHTLMNWNRSINFALAVGSLSNEIGEAK